MNKDMTGFFVKIGLGVIGLIVILVLISNMMTTVRADEIVIKQDFIGGNLNVWNSSGVHWKNFGTITRYKRSAQLWFSAKEDEGKKTDDSIRVRFNDGAHGNISGSLRYSLPTDANKMIELHQSFHSMEAIDHELIRQVVNKSVYMSGPLMSSRESYAEKRADLINYITDQITAGVYRTEHEQVKIVDPLTNQEKTVDLVRPKQNDHSPNGIEREEISPIQQYGINASNITINGIDYDPAVEAQIKVQQEAVNAVQQSMLNAKKAEQDTLTVELQGKAEAAKAKWSQEVEKATQITKSEQEKEVALIKANQENQVAKLNLETAKLAAQKTMTEAKADADSKRLAIQADNQLEMKINAWVKVNENYANALGAQRQTPDVLIGGTSGGNNTQNLIDMMTAKTASELGVSVHPK